MLLMRIIVPLLVVGLMSVSAGVAFGDSHGDGGNATSTDDGLATSTDDGLATSTDDGLATSTDDGLATSTDDGLDDPQRRSFPGTVYYLGDGIVTIAKNGAMADVSLGDVVPKTPGGPNNQGTWGEEANVVVHAEWDGSQWVAIWVIVKPIKPTFAALVGTVIGTEDGVTTIVLPNGKTKKIKKPEGEEDPEDGEIVTVFIDESGDGEGTGDDEPAEVTGLVNASKIADRIESFLEKLAAKDASLPQAVIDARQRLVTNLAAVLDNHSAQQVSIIEKVSKAQGLGSGTAAGLQKALEKAQANRDRGRAIADDARSKVGVAQGAGQSDKGNAGTGASADDADDADDADSDSSSGLGKPSDKGKPAGAGSKSVGKGGKSNSEG